MEFSTENLEKGVKLCLKNARRLIEDANLLIDNGSFGHALFFLITSIEEVSKAFMYTSSRLESQKIEELKEVYRHDIKCMYYLSFILGQLILIYGKTREKYEGKPLDIDDFFILGEDLTSSLEEMLALREWSLYVDFEDGEWFSPFDIKHKDVTTLVAFAENHLKNIERLCEILLKIPSDLLTQLKEYIEKQLVPSYLEELYKKKAISERVYSGIRKGLEQAKRESSQKMKQ